MGKYKFNITQTFEYEVFIEADSLEEAEKEFDEYISDDFGEPTSGKTEWVCSRAWGM